MSAISIICRLCGKPMVLPMPDDIDASLRRIIVEKLAPLTVHNVCGDHRWMTKNETDRAKLVDDRSKQWPGICPPLYQDTVWEQIPNPKKDKIMAWEYGQKGLIVFGPTRTGKTRSVFEMLKKQHMDGKRIIAMTHTEFVKEAKRVAFDAPSVQTRWSANVATADILFIDDFGKSRFVDLNGDALAAEEFLWDVLESRWERKLPCIFTTNSDGDGLLKSLGKERGAPLLARLREFCISIGYK